MNSAGRLEAKAAAHAAPPIPPLPDLPAASTSRSKSTAKAPQGIRHSARHSLPPFAGQHLPALHDHVHVLRIELDAAAEALG